MSAAASTPRENKRETRLPPRRGLIKAQIFESFKKTIVSAASALAKNRPNGDNSAAGTPPASAYTSDANSNA